MTPAIVNGHAIDGKFCSNHLISLLEWCLNYKMPVYFQLRCQEYLFDVEIRYEEAASVGNYLRDEHECYLTVMISLCGEKTLGTRYDSLVVDDCHTVEDAANDFKRDWGEEFLLKRAFGK